MRIFKLGVAMIWLATPLSAQVTAQDVWDSVKGNLERLWQVSAVVSDEAGGLTVSRLTLKHDSGAAATVLTPITLVERPDGSVLIRLDEPWKAQAVTSSNAYIAARLEGDGLQITASGRPDRIVFGLTARSAQLKFSDSSDGFSEDRLTVRARDLMADAVLTDTPSGEIDGNLAASRVVIDHLSGNRNVTATQTRWQFEDLTSSIEANLPAAFFSQQIDLREHPTASFEFDATYGKNSTKVTQFLPREPQVETDATAASGLIRLALSDGYASVEAENRQIKTPLVLGRQPMPGVDLLADTIAMRFRAPFAFAETSRSFDAALDMSGLTLPPLFWAMVDTQNILPHDPINFEADVSGSGQLAFRLPGSVASILGDNLIDALAINMLEFDGLGAGLTATGQFQFDHTDKPTGAQPRIEGALDVGVKGFDEVLSDLVELGVISTPQSLMAQAAKAFYTDTASDGSLTSKLRFTPDGSITANGVPLR